MLKAEFLRARIFQFTPLREGRPLLMRVCAGQHSTRFQFTPLREGRREALQAPINRVHDISIHAPPRGATRRAAARFGRFRISIHAPPRGATRQKSATV